MVTAQFALENADEVSENIDELVAADSLNACEWNALVSSLDAALCSLAVGDTSTAVDQLNAFINKVEANGKSNKLDLPTARDLIDSATAILAALGADTVGKGPGGPRKTPYQGRRSSRSER